MKSIPRLTSANQNLAISAARPGEEEEEFVTSGIWGDYRDASLEREKEEEEDELSKRFPGVGKQSRQVVLRRLINCGNQ